MQTVADIAVTGPGIPVPPPLTSTAPPNDLFYSNYLLEGITPAVYREVVRRIQVVRIDRDGVLFEENDPGDCLYLIARGSVRISKRGRGGQQETLAHLMPPDFFGEMALIDDAKRSAQASTCGETVLGRVDRETWDLLLRLAPHEVMGNFVRTVTKRLRHNNQHFIEEMMRNERLSLLGTTISSIVHDMNNPINSILNACHLLETNVQEELAAAMTKIIRESVSSMEVMSREMIDFSRGKTALRLQKITVRHLMADLEPEFRKCHPYVDLQTNVEFDGEMTVDRYRLLRVFANLIRNAREAMQESTRRRLAFQVVRRGDNVEFQISDTGCGIPPELLPRIFEPFMTQGKQNGTGLGLAISKAVVDAHHGSIAVESDAAGTRFHITLPVAPPVSV